MLCGPISPASPPSNSKQLIELLSKDKGSSVVNFTGKAKNTFLLHLNSNETWILDKGAMNQIFTLTNFLADIHLKPIQSSH